MYQRNTGRTFGRKSSFRGSFKGRAPIRGRFRNFRSSRIDVSRYINKGVIIEEVAPFIPEHKFNDFLIEERLKVNIAAKGYKIPTPIQDKAIPKILQGSDLVGIANTGTGKTAAFLVPLINKALLNKKEQTLIVVPTRELALQINEELKIFTKGLGFFSVCCTGGSSLGNQLRELRYYNNFIIGTPGRLKDLSKRKAINLSTFRTVVLDEADRMLDMGFIGDMRFMLSKMPAERQTLFFSATLSPEIEKLINEFLRSPILISVKTGSTAKNIEQDIVQVKDASGKIDALHDLLIKKEFERVLIFGRTKHGVEKLSRLLIERGFKSVSIHGNKSQPQRERALRDFKGNKASIMVATDVAARGLDIDDITHVINFDIPASHDDYIHRIGRTGRNNKKGTALTFVE